MKPWLYEPLKYNQFKTKQKPKMNWYNLQVDNVGIRVCRGHGILGNNLTG